MLLKLFENKMFEYLTDVVNIYLSFKRSYEIFVNACGFAIIFYNYIIKITFEEFSIILTSFGC